MRLTLLHADRTLAGLRSTDVEVVPGTTAGVLRQEVARLTGGHEWASTRCRLVADGVPLDDSHPAGLAPLLPGAVLSTNGRTAPADQRALICARHLAVTAGPDAGSLLPLDGPADVRVGPDELLRVRDDTWATTRLRVRCRPAHRRLRWLRAGHEPAPVVLVRASGAALLVRARRWRGGRRNRPVPRRRWRRWPLGAEVHVGATVLMLRDARPLHLAPGSGDGDTRTRTVAARHDGARAGTHRAATAVPMLGTVITGLVLAVAVHQPLLLLTGLTGPLLWWANRRTGSQLPLSPPTEQATSAPDVAALRLLTARPAARVDDVRVPVPWDSGGCLAVVGPRPLAVAVARGAVLAELGSAGACSVAVQGTNASDWSWLVWTDGSCVGLPVAGDPHSPARALVVVDSPEDEAAVARWRAGSPAAQRLVWVGADARAVPSWCRNVLTVGPAGAQLEGPGGAPRPVRLVGVQRDVAEAQARALARRRPSATGASDDDAGGAVPLDACPDDVLLGALPGVPVPQAAAVAAAWAAPPHGLSSPLGLGPGGSLARVDLVRDGPHAVIAGTTGAGKSELLTTLVLGLALAYPPQQLALLLVDFKGGTGLPGLAGLPHVVGRLSDLDATGARRVLLGLGAELRRRERLLAAAGARELDELSGAVPAGGAPVPARLLVVIDEFRALADDLPELLPGLARLAAQGRSLGVHLVLATQRPAGAVPAELRANVSLRVALRVLDPADSTDLVGVPDAARIGARTPGRAVLLRGGGTVQAVQVARADVGSAQAPVRLARPALDLLGSRPGTCWTPHGRAARPGADAVGRWVAAARVAAVHLPAPDVPWLPELPTRVAADDVPAGCGLPLGVADLPDEQRRAAVRWRPDSGHLLVLGGPRSGRTTALVSAGRQALAAGRAVHAVGLPPAAARVLGVGAPAGLGSLVAAEDVVTTARLLELLTGAAQAGPRPVLLVDQLDLVLERLSTLARGAAADRLTALWERSGPPVALVASGPVSSASSRLLGSFADRLVLGVADPALDALAGVPTTLAGPRVAPGRAVHLRAGTAVLCQLALPAEAPPSAEPAEQPAGPPKSSAGTDRGGPVRLVPLPAVAFRAAARARRGPAGCLRIPVGLGGDDGGTVEVDLVDSLLVVGPPGSGRSTALSALSTMVGSLGARLLGLGGGGAAGVAVGRTATQLPALLADGGELVLVLDDLDELERCEPTAMQAVADRLAAQRGADRNVPSLRVVAATTTAHAAASFRGLVPVLLRGRRVLALDLREPGSVELLGPRAAWLADPAGGPPGRGALGTERQVVPVQLWAGGAGCPAQPGC